MAPRKRRANWSVPPFTAVDPGYAVDPVPPTPPDPPHNPDQPHKASGHNVAKGTKRLADLLLSAICPVPVVFAREYGMSTQPEVAKTIWTDADFDAMGWHDNAVHAVALEPAPSEPGRLLLDIDYIVEWVPPEAPATTLSFWICPATLVFDRAWDLTTDIDLHGWSFQLFLNAIERSGPDEHGYFDWTLAGDHFTIGLNAPGFTQYLRHAPIRSHGHWLSVDERGGFSFEQRGYTH